ncbi:MAG: hypothetical protein ACLGH0_05425 [Thermoanaerobaculia bacterium]
MHSDELEAKSRLLDPAFGFFVWAAHLVVIYVIEAVACQLGRTRFVPALVVVTFAAAAIVLLHGARRYRQRGEMRDYGFLIRIAIGHDALAALAILCQLFAILMVPVCR